MSTPVSNRRRPNSLTPARRNMATTPTTGGSSQHNRLSLPPSPSSERRHSLTPTRNTPPRSLPQNRSSIRPCSPPPSSDRSFSRGRSVTAKPVRQALSVKNTLYESSPSEDSASCGTLLDPTFFDALEENKKHPNSGGRTKVRDNSVSSKHRHDKENNCDKEAAAQQSMFTLNEARSYETTSTTPYNDMGITPVATGDMYGNEKIEMVTTATSMASTMSHDKTTLTNAFESMNHLFTSNMKELREAKNRMDLALEQKMASFASEVEYIRSKTEAEAIIFVDQHLERNKELEAQLVAINHTVDMMKTKCDEMNAQRRKAKKEARETMEELISTRNLADLRNDECADLKKRLQQQIKENEQKDEQVRRHLSIVKELNKKLDLVNAENKSLEEELESTIDELSSKLDAAVEEKKILQDKVEDAHAKLIALADEYKDEQKKVEILEQKLGENDRMSNRESRAREDELLIENEKLKKKYARMKELHNSGLSKCNQAAAAYKKSSKLPNDGSWL